jgi:hypothetical protein
VAPQVDAIATSRFDAQTGADREVQRILMELLNQMDGFDQTVNVKVGRRRCWAAEQWRAQLAGAVGWAGRVPALSIGMAIRCWGARM